MKINFLRSVETEKEYNKKKQERRERNRDTSGSFLNKLDKIALKVFKYWVIVPARFPYDMVAETHNIVFIRRDVVFKWELLTKEEREELDFLKKTYFQENYDAIWENFPATQSIPGRFHLHLIKLRNEER